MKVVSFAVFNNMETVRTTFKNAWPYQQAEMNLPVGNLNTAVPFYERVLGFQVVSQHNSPFPAVILERNAVQIGLAENG
jgi:catechol-2,3-dioxygenase